MLREDNEYLVLLNNKSSDDDISNGVPILQGNRRRQDTPKSGIDRARKDNRPVPAALRKAAGEMASFSRSQSSISPLPKYHPSILREPRHARTKSAEGVLAGSVQQSPAPIIPGAKSILNPGEDRLYPIESAVAAHGSPRHRRVQSGSSGDSAAISLIRWQAGTNMSSQSSTRGGIAATEHHRRSNSAGDETTAKPIDGGVGFPLFRSASNTETPASKRLEYRRSYPSQKVEVPLKSWQATSSLHYKSIRSSGIGASPIRHTQQQKHGAFGKGLGHRRTRSVPTSDTQLLLAADDLNRGYGALHISSYAQPAGQKNPAQHTTRSELDKSPVRLPKRPDHGRPRSEGLPPISPGTKSSRPLRMRAGLQADAPLRARTESDGSAASVKFVKAGPEKQGSQRRRTQSDSDGSRAKNDAQCHPTVFLIERSGSDISVPSVVKCTDDVAIENKTLPTHPFLRRVDYTPPLSGQHPSPPTLPVKINSFQDPSTRTTMLAHHRGDSTLSNFSQISVATDMSITSHKTDITNKSSIFRHTNSGMIELHLPMDNVRLVTDERLEAGILYKFEDINESKRFLEYHLTSIPNDDMQQDPFTDNFQPFACSCMCDNCRLCREKHHQNLPEVHYIMAVEDDIYKRVLSEMVGNSELPCGLYFCMRDEYLGRPSILIAIVIVVAVICVLFMATLKWAYP